MSLEYSVLLLQAAWVWSLVGELICLQCRRPRFNAWVRKIPWRWEWLPPPVFLLSTKILVFLAWRITWTEEPGRPQSMGFQRFRSNWATNIHCGTKILYAAWKVKMKSLSCVQLFATPWTVAHQASPSMGFSRQEYWCGLPFPSPGDLPHPGIEPRSPSLQTDALPSEPQGKSYMLHGEVKKKKRKKKKVRNSHVVQCESSMLSLPRALVQSLVGELRSCRLCGWPKKEKER